MQQELIYVLAPNGKPLMPTRRHGHVQKLLKQGKARIAEHEPFVIQLKYNTPEITQPLYGGTDPGRTNIGNAVVDMNGVAVYRDKVETRNLDEAGTVLPWTRRRGSAHSMKKGGHRAVLTMVASACKNESTTFSYNVCATTIPQCSCNGAPQFSA